MPIIHTTVFSHRQGGITLLLPSASTTKKNTIHTDTVCHAETIVSTLVISSVDYCNSALSGLAAVTLAPLQRFMQHAAVCLVANLSFRHRVTALIQATLASDRPSHQI